MRIALPLHARRSSSSLWSHLQAALRVYHSRRGLKRLDDHMLDDIGLTRHQAMTEAKRPVWDAPSRWHY